MTDREALSKVRVALLEEFGSCIDSDPARAKESIERHTFLPMDDPGQWAANAVVVIHAESIGLPGPWEADGIEVWASGSNRLDGFYCEHVNNAVVAVYREWK